LKSVFKRNNLQTNSRAIKRSLSSRSLCFVPRFQSVVPSSVPARLATRSLPFFRRGYFYFFQLISCSAIALPFSDEKKQTATCVLAVALPPAINLNWNANADFFIFFGCRYTLLSLLSTAQKLRYVLGLGWLSVTATPPPASAKKSFLRVGINNAFFASLGVFIVGIHTNALRLFAHFFRRLPKGIYLKNNILQWQSSKKIERLMKAYQPKPGPEFKVLGFFGKLILRELKYFFFIGKSNEKNKKFNYL
jgi:hypothetical protein